MHDITQTLMLSPTLHYIHPLLEITADVQAVAFLDATLSVLDFCNFLYL